MARPTKKSPERVEALLAALRIGSTRTNSCAVAEISLETFARWMAEDAEFRGAVTKAEGDAEMRFLGQVAKHAAKSPQAAQWWLERRRPKDYRQLSAVELTGRDGGPIESRSVTDGLSETEWDALEKMLREAAHAGD